MRFSQLVRWSVVGAFLGAACSASSGNKSDTTGSGGSAAGGAGGSGPGGSGGSVSVGGTGGTGVIMTDSGTGGVTVDPDGACNSVTQAAETQFEPADIVWGIDTSCSMIEESLAVQNNINAFSQQITASGIDVQVVMIASYPFGFIPGVCVPAPLGSGVCPPAGTDTLLPHFWHHPTQIIQSNDGLNVFYNTFSSWDFMLRPGATKHIVIVTDDNATDAPYNNAAQFITDFTALSPKLQDSMGAPAWQMHGIYSFTSCPSAAAVGTVWKDIIAQTGGVEGDLCTQQFQPVFDALAAQVVAGSKPLDCEWGIPPPPPGQQFDPQKVNVDFSGSGGTETIFNVPSQADCDPTLGGWYYDDPVNPTRVIACAETCNKITSDENGAIDIAFGCATQQIPK